MNEKPNSSRCHEHSTNGTAAVTTILKNARQTGTLTAAPIQQIAPLCASEKILMPELPDSVDFMGGGGGSGTNGSGGEVELDTSSIDETLLK